MTLVIGPNARQQNHLQQKHKNIIVLSNDHALRVFQGIDRVILMTKFISHHHQDQIIKLYGRGKIRMVYGSVSAVSKEIESCSK